MQTVFLKTGQSANLIQKVESGKFLVDPIFEYEGYEGELYEQASGRPILVDEIFKSAPIEKISADFLEIENKYNEVMAKLIIANSDLREAEKQLKSVEEKKLSLEKWQVDLSRFKKADNMVFFSSEYGCSFSPVVIYKKDLRSYNFEGGVKINFRLRCDNGEMCADWIDIDWDGREGWSNKKIDVKHGIHFNLTDEQITELTLQRNSEHDISKMSLSDISRVPEKYMTDSMIAKAKELKHESNQLVIKRLKEEIDKKQKEIEKLTNAG